MTYSIRVTTKSNKEIIIARSYTRPQYSEISRTMKFNGYIWNNGKRITVKKVEMVPNR